MKQKSVVIVGACSGIGLAYAKHLSGLGHQVYASAINEKKAQDLQLAIPKAIVLTVDLRMASDIKQCCSFLRKELSAVDVLICNAGIPIGGPVAHLDLEQLREVFQVNVFGHLDMIQGLLETLQKSQNPRLVWTGSAAGYFVRPLLGGYAASKFAVTAIVDALRVEWYNHIHVSHIMPGGIRTDIWTRGVEAASAMENKVGLEDYHTALRKLKEEAQHNAKNAVSVQKVVDAMHHAVFSSNPKPVYRIGLDAHLAYWLKWFLPQRLVDWLLRKLCW